MFNFKNEEKEYQKKSATKNIILTKLEEMHKARVKEVEASDAFIEFDEVLRETDPEAARLYALEQELKTALSNLVEQDTKNQFEDFFQDSIKYNPISNRLVGYIRKKKVEAFPEVFNGFNYRKMDDLVDAYLTVYDDYKNVDKIVQQVVERVEA